MNGYENDPALLVYLDMSPELGRETFRAFRGIYDDFFVYSYRPAQRPPQRGEHQETSVRVDSSCLERWVEELELELKNCLEPGARIMSPSAWVSLDYNGSSFSGTVSPTRGSWPGGFHDVMDDVRKELGVQ